MVTGTLARFQAGRPPRPSVSLSYHSRSASTTFVAIIQASADSCRCGLHVAMADALFFFLNSGFGRLP